VFGQERSGFIHLSQYKWKVGLRLLFYVLKMKIRWGNQSFWIVRDMKRITNIQGLTSSSCALICQRLQLIPNGHPSSSIINRSFSNKTSGSSNLKEDKELLNSYVGFFPRLNSLATLNKSENSEFLLKLSSMFSDLGFIRGTVLTHYVYTRKKLIIYFDWFNVLI
jgi:hypothetical protein